MSEPNAEGLWWSSLSTTVKQLSELLATRPQVKKLAPAPEPVAIEIEGTMTRTDMPRATIIANERLFSMPDTARWLGVSRSYLEKKMKHGSLTTFTPEFYRSAKRTRRFIREEELKRFLGGR